jgi:anti-sigma B factor antagonist
MTVQRQPQFAAQIAPIDGEPVTLVSVTGEIDIATAPALRDVLDLAIERGVAVIVDFAGIAFFDSAGAAVLDGAARRARLAHGRLTVRNPGAMVYWVLQTLSLDGLLDQESRPTGTRASRPPSVSSLQVRK